MPGGHNIMSSIKWEGIIKFLGSILQSFMFFYFSPSAAANLIKPYLREDELELLELELEEEEGDLLLL